MTLEQLRIFIAVAERQHMTAAAAVLGLTQSAASAAIANLENQYGVALFDRVGRGIVLTEEGALFLKEARAILQRTSDAEAVLYDLTQQVRGSLRLAASQTVGTYWLPGRIVQFRRQYPGVTVACGIANSEQVAAAVRDGEVPLGFIEGAIADSLLTSRIVARDKPVLVVGANHPWFGRTKPLRPAELAGTAWILREKGSGTRAVFDAALIQRKIDPARLDILLELPSNEAVASAVSAGAAASVLSTSVVLAGLEAGFLSAVPCDLPERAFSLIRHKRRHLSRCAQAFLAALDPAAGRTRRD